MYKALYRKWRPAAFDEVCGQEHVTTVLRNQVISNTVSHAYLFCGTHGTGKTTCAKVLAKAVNCLAPENGSPCGKCSACIEIDSGTSTDVLEIDAASNNGVDGIRSIRDEVVYPPSTLKKRVYIIDEVHMLTDSANNALLKTLEEPPEYVLFILATTELQKIPATILSRCQRFEFRRIDADVISDRVRHVCANENIEIDDEAVNLIARLSDGAMRDALSLLESCTASSKTNIIDYASAEKQLGVANNEEVVSLLQFAAEGNVSSAMDVLDRLYKGSRDLATLIDQLTYLTRDLLVIQSLPGITLNRLGSSFCFSHSMFDSLTALAETTTKETLVCFFDVLSEARSRMGLSAHNKRLVAEMAVIKLSQPSFSDGIDALRARVAALEAGIPLRSAPTVQADKPKETVKKENAPPQKKESTKPSKKGFSAKAEFLDALVKRGAGSIYAFASTCTYSLEDTTLHIYPDNAIGYSVLSAESALSFLTDAASFDIKANAAVSVHEPNGVEAPTEIPLDDLM